MNHAGPGETPALSASAPQPGRIILHVQPCCLPCAQQGTLQKKHDDERSGGKAADDGWRKVTGTAEPAPRTGGKATLFPAASSDGTVLPFRSVLNGGQTNPHSEEALPEKRLLPQERLLTLRQNTQPRKANPSFPTHVARNAPKIRQEAFPKNDVRHAWTVRHPSVRPARDDNFGMRIVVLNKLVHMGKLYSS